MPNPKIEQRKKVYEITKTNAIGSANRGDVRIDDPSNEFVITTPIDDLQEAVDDAVSGGKSLVTFENDMTINANGVVIPDGMRIQVDNDRKVDIIQNDFIQLKDKNMVKLNTLGLFSTHSSLYGVHYFIFNASSNRYERWAYNGRQHILLSQSTHVPLGGYYNKSYRLDPQSNTITMFIDAIGTSFGFPSDINYNYYNFNKTVNPDETLSMSDSEQMYKLIEIGKVQINALDFLTKGILSDNGSSYDVQDEDPLIFDVWSSLSDTDTLADYFILVGSGNSLNYARFMRFVNLPVSGNIYFLSKDSVYNNYKGTAASPPDPYLSGEGASFDKLVFADITHIFAHTENEDSQINGQPRKSFTILLGGKGIYTHRLNDDTSFQLELLLSFQPTFSKFFIDGNRDIYYLAVKDDSQTYIYHRVENMSNSFVSSEWELIEIKEKAINLQSISKLFGNDTNLSILSFAIGEEIQDILSGENYLERTGYSDIIRSDEKEIALTGGYEDSPLYQFRCDLIEIEQLYQSDHVWSLQELSGNLLDTGSVGGKDITTINNILYNQSLTVMNAKKMISFSGSNSYIQTPDLDMSQDWSISFITRVTPKSGTGINVLMASSAFHNGSYDRNDFAFLITQSNHASGNYYALSLFVDNGGVQSQFYSDIQIPNEMYIHVIITFDVSLGRFKIYVDNNEILSVTSDYTSWSSTSGIQVGGRNFGTGWVSEADMDVQYLQFDQKILTDTERSRLFRQGRKVIRDSQGDVEKNLVISDLATIDPETNITGGASVPFETSADFNNVFNFREHTLSEGINKMTMMGWFYIVPDGTTKRIFSTLNISDDNTILPDSAIYIELTASNQIRLGVIDGSGIPSLNIITLDNPTIFASDQWVHIVLHMPEQGGLGATFKLYVNNTFVGQLESDYKWGFTDWRIQPTFFFGVKPDVSNYRTSDQFVGLKWQDLRFYGFSGSSTILDMDGNKISAIYNATKGTFSKVHNARVEYDIENTGFSAKGLVSNGEQIIFNPVTYDGTPRRYGDSVNYNDAGTEYLILFGGEDDLGGDVLTTDKIELPDESQTTMNDIPTGVRHFSSQLVGTKVYVFGGLDSGGNPLAIMQILDLTTGVWSSGTAASDERYYHDSIVINNVIYYFGGKDVLGDTTDIGLTYDIDTDTWDVGIDLAEPISKMKMFESANKIYVFFGENSIDDPHLFIDIYDTIQEFWTTVDTTVDRQDFQIMPILFGKYIVLYGGHTKAGSNTPTFLFFDTDKNELLVDIPVYSTGKGIELQGENKLIGFDITNNQSLYSGHSNAPIHINGSNTEIMYNTIDTNRRTAINVEVAPTVFTSTLIHNNFIEGDTGINNICKSGDVSENVINTASFGIIGGISVPLIHSNTIISNIAIQLVKNKDYNVYCNILNGIQYAILSTDVIAKAVFNLINGSLNNITADNSNIFDTSALFQDQADKNFDLMSKAEGFFLDSICIGKGHIGEDIGAYRTDRVLTGISVDKILEFEQNIDTNSTFKSIITMSEINNSFIQKFGFNSNYQKSLDTNFDRKVFNFSQNYALPMIFMRDLYLFSKEDLLLYLRLEQESFVPNLFYLYTVV